REQLADAISAGELGPLDVDVTAMALYGAIRSAGEYVIESADTRASVPIAEATIHALIDGLRRNSRTAT
ncbi:MAG TPA: hypothetical protein VMF35_12200, partial [Acidimicrobiales bacterium]|nr:hypothetical protein [Acidimicrobiales bacterium]